jgi:phosphomethylpyrimidine synthase
MVETATTFANIVKPEPYPASTKQFLVGSREDIRVPFREIALSPTKHGDRVEENPALPVYDTSGPYTDPEVDIEIAQGLDPVRADWIVERGDTERLQGVTSAFGSGRTI